MVNRSVFNSGTDAVVQPEVLIGLYELKCGAADLREHQVRNEWTHFFCPVWSCRALC